MQLPSKVAIVKVRGHAAGDSEEVRGNQLADAAAIETAKKPCNKAVGFGEVAMMAHVTNFKILQTQSYKG